MLIEPALVRGPQDAREDLLSVRATSRAVAVTADLAGDDRRPDRLLGAPVRGVEIGIHQEAKERRQFHGEMAREALNLRDDARVAEHVEHLVQEMPARHIDAVRRDGAGGAAVAHIEGVLQDREDAGGKAGPWMITL